jgi:hypothetical protein
MLTVIRMIKEDLVWPNDFQKPFELQTALDKWVVDYNTYYPHSSLNYKNPSEFERISLEKLSKFFVA